MRQQKRWRYYCDFCKKSSGTQSAMIKHEKGCTKNPSRECGLCRINHGGANLPISNLVAVLEDGSPEKMKALRELTENCPACILAAIRQAPPEQLTYAMNNHEGDWTDFKFMDEVKSFWADHPRDRDSYL